MKNLLASTVCLLLLSGCNYREEKGIKKLFSTEPNFTEVREQIFKPNCFGCHSGPMAAQGIDLFNYSKLMKSDVGVVEPGEPLNSTLYLNVQSGRMPPSGSRLTDSEIKLIFDWIQGGAKEN